MTEKSTHVAVGKEELMLNLVALVLGLPGREKEAAKPLDLDSGFFIAELPQEYIEGLEQRGTNKRSEVLREFFEWGFHKFNKRKAISNVGISN